MAFYETSLVILHPLFFLNYGIFSVCVSVEGAVFFAY